MMDVTDELATESGHELWELQYCILVLVLVDLRSPNRLEHDGPLSRVLDRLYRSIVTDGLLFHPLDKGHPLRCGWFGFPLL